MKAGAIIGTLALAGIAAVGTWYAVSRLAIPDKGRTKTPQGTGSTLGRDTQSAGSGQDLSAAFDRL